MSVYAVLPAAQAPADARAEFLAKTYTHLAGAVFLFVALEAVLVNTAAGVALAVSMMQTNWLLVLGLFMVASWVAEKWAHSGQSTSLQYAGLAFYVAAWAVLFLPLMVYVSYGKPGALAPAAGLTLATFGGLTAYVFISKADFSWLRGILVVGTILAFGLIVVATLGGLNLGIWFCVAMVALSAISILYTTSSVMNDFPVGGHVGAALALFSALAMMFWYILQIFASRD